MLELRSDVIVKTYGPDEHRFDNDQKLVLVRAVINRLIDRNGVIFGKTYEVEVIDDIIEVTVYEIGRNMTIESVEDLIQKVEQVFQDFIDTYISFKKMAELVVECTKTNSDTQ